jgi:hypothetical protein
MKNRSGSKLYRAALNELWLPYGGPSSGGNDSVVAGMNVYLSDEDVASYRENPDAFCAARHGMEVSDYLEWVKKEGRALCGARDARNNGAIARGGGATSFSTGRGGGSKSDELASERAGSPLSAERKGSTTRRKLAI